MKRIIIFFAIILLSVGMVSVSAQTDGAKRKPTQTTTTHQSAASNKQTTISKSSSARNNSTGGSSRSGSSNAPTIGTSTYAPNVRTYNVNGVSFQMVEVRGGTFLMGATSEQGSEAESDEKPTHQVTLSTYYIGKTEVTQALWKAVMGSNPSHWKGDNLPVEEVSWDDCQDFIRRLNAKTGKKFRLPTEAEWEFAARGGSKSRGYKYSGSNNLAAVAWYGDNSGNKSHPVGTKQANELGIYDMSGNVYEWCQDRKGNYTTASQTNPKGVSSGARRVNRGGCWHSYARICRSSIRGDDTPVNRCEFLGLRLVLSE